MKKVLSFVLIALAFCSCSSDCSKLETELEVANAHVLEKDSILDMLGASFRKIDSNINEAKMIEMELVDGIRNGAGSAEVQTKVDLLKQVLESNKHYIQSLKSNLGSNTAMSNQLFDIVSSLEGKVLLSNNRLAGLNKELGDLGDEYRNVFYEYLNAEVERQNAEENIQNLKGTMNEMEEKMSDLKDQLKPGLRSNWGQKQFD